MPKSPLDIPIRDRIGLLIRDLPGTDRQSVISEDDAAHVIAHYWPEIERHIREQVARDLLAVDPADWALAGQHAGQHAARIARNGPKES
ncbi:hypothetical protein [Kitasatospora fiedleri]|uniref:hypothetical protein n=1 Tax=Kitasatospora fiedleri TaxID=2991545 RepID=UPI002499DD8C|nr:hypothetical protein [Kitasatospora fiedleri]